MRSIVPHKPRRVAVLRRTKTLCTQRLAILLAGIAALCSVSPGLNDPTVTFGIAALLVGVLSLVIRFVERPRMVIIHEFEFHPHFPIFYWPPRRR
jgi:uncharacterized membrane protein HdeD (DUF308 family)